jgi:hypothetical protein
VAALALPLLQITALITPDEAARFDLERSTGAAQQRLVVKTEAALAGPSLRSNMRSLRNGLMPLLMPERVNPWGQNGPVSATPGMIGLTPSGHDVLPERFFIAEADFSNGSTLNEKFRIKAMLSSRRSQA